MSEDDLIRDAERKIARILADLDEAVSDHGNSISDVFVDLRAYRSGFGGLGVEILTHKDAG